MVEYVSVTYWRSSPRLRSCRGRLIHAWLERIDWLDQEHKLPENDVLLDMAEQAVGRQDPAWFDAMMEKFKSMLMQPTVRDVLTRQSIDESSGQQIVLWREHPFAEYVDGQLMTGVFDRVVVIEQDGQPLSADLIDFKTDVVSVDEVPHRVESYRLQIEAYRSVLSVQLGLGRRSIRARLLFVESDVYHDI